jgi:hypothetical protein
MHPLNNVIWTALTSEQANFAEANQFVSRFPADVGPLAGLKEPNAQGFHFLADLLNQGEAAALFLDEPQEVPTGFTVVATAPLLQMVKKEPTACPEEPLSATQFTELGVDDIPDMLALTRLTQPGPFGNANPRAWYLFRHPSIRKFGGYGRRAVARFRISRGQRGLHASPPQGAWLCGRVDASGYGGNEGSHRNPFPACSGGQRPSGRLVRATGIQAPAPAPSCGPPKSVAAHLST